MTASRRTVPVVLVFSLVIAGMFSLSQAQTAGNHQQRDRFHRRSGHTHNEGQHQSGDEIREAPTGFDNQSNGFDNQGPAFETLTAANVIASRSFNDNRFLFEEVETIADVWGPPITRRVVANVTRMS